MLTHYKSIEFICRRHDCDTVVNIKTAWVLRRFLHGRHLVGNFSVSYSCRICLGCNLHTGIMFFCWPTSQPPTQIIQDKNSSRCLHWDLVLDHGCVHSWKDGMVLVTSCPPGGWPHLICICLQIVTGQWSPLALTSASLLTGRLKPTLPGEPELGKHCLYRWRKVTEIECYHLILKTTQSTKERYRRPSFVYVFPKIWFIICALVNIFVHIIYDPN